jgi:serine protease inhibitor
MEILPPASNIAFEHGISDFSFSLYSAVPKSGDEFISPFSVSAALLLLMLGTDGTTKRQMTSTIFRGHTPRDINIGQLFASIRES